MNGSVTGVERHRLDRMTAEQARLTPGTPIDELRHGLQSHYPGLPEDAEVDVVAFDLTPPINA